MFAQRRTLNTVRELPRLTAAGAIVAAALSAPASATEWLDWERWTSGGTAVQSRAEGPWRVNAGLGGALGPVYLGGSEYEFKPLALVDLDYQGFAFLSTQRGAGVHFWRRSTYRIGARFTYDFGRDSSAASVLRGVPDVDPGVEGGVFLEAFTGRVRIQADLRQELAGGHGGFLASGGVAYGLAASEGLSVFVGGDVTYMGEEYANAYFGVPAGAALPAYQAEAGLRDVSPYAQLVYHFSPNFYGVLDARAHLLLGEAADSPVSEDDYAFIAGAMLGYRF